MANPRWTRNNPKIFDSDKQFAQRVMQNPALRRNIQTHMHLIQRAVDRGDLKSEQALNIFRTDMKNLSQQTKNAYNLTVKKTQSIDQTNLTNPLNMQAALQNPYSFASQQADNTVGAIITDLNNTEANIELNEEQQVENALKTTETAGENNINTDQNTTDQSLAPTPKPGVRPKNNEDEDEDNKVIDTATKRIETACEKVSETAIAVIGLDEAASDTAIAKATKAIGDDLGMDTSKLSADIKKAADSVESETKKSITPFKTTPTPPDK